MCVFTDWYMLSFIVILFILLIRSLIIKNIRRVVLYIFIQNDKGELINLSKNDKFVLSIDGEVIENKSNPFKYTSMVIFKKNKRNNGYA